MSLLKAIKTQLGLSNTPANNFTITAEADNGTLKLARGNAGATTQDILTVDANGRVAMPQNAIYASIYKTSISAASATMTVVTDMTTDFSSNVTIANGRITVPVAGVYQVNFGASFDITTDAQLSGLYVNGLFWVAAGGPLASGFNNRPQGSYLLSLAANGYVELAAQRGSTACNIANGRNTFISICLIAKA